jgi:ribosomal protein L18E
VELNCQFPWEWLAGRKSKVILVVGRSTSSKPLKTAMAIVAFPIPDDAAEKIRDFSFHHQRARELRG